MATTIVKRGAGRPAATARTAKAAQRTPLPPRSGSRMVATDAEVSPSPESTKRAPRTIVDRVALGPKAKSFYQVAKDAGWKIGVEVDSTRRTVVTATRGVEVVRVWFTPTGNMDLEDFPAYFRAGLEGRRVKLRNVSAAKKQIALPEEDRPVKAVLKPRELVVEVPQRTLPFDPETATDAEVVAACNGARIKWRNGTTKLVEIAFVHPNSKTIRITPNRDLIALGARLLHFPARDGRIRVVRLDRMLSVEKTP